MKYVQRQKVLENSQQNFFDRVSQLFSYEFCEIFWHRSGVFIVNFEQISYIVLLFLLLTLTKQMQERILCIYSPSSLLLQTYLMKQ